MPPDTIEKRILLLEQSVANLQRTVPDHRHNGFDNTKVSIPDLALIVYAQMYTNTQTTVTVSVTDTWYEVTSNFSAGQITGAKFGGSHYIQLSQNGIYLVVYGISIETATADQQIAGTVMVNGSARVEPQGHTTVTAANLSHTVAGSAILNLSAGDQISLAVENHTLATDIVVEHANVSLVRIA